MMKVYDMVTYGMYDPDESATPYAYGSPQADHPTAVPALQLQTLQLNPTTDAGTFPPSLHDVDIGRFLDGICD
jgi:hypothetical protein